MSFVGIGTAITIEDGDLIGVSGGSTGIPDPIPLPKARGFLIWGSDNITWDGDKLHWG